MTDTASKTDYIVATDAAPIAVDVVADIGNARTVVLVRRDGEDVPMALTMPSVRSLHGAFSWGTVRRAQLAPQSWGNWSATNTSSSAMGLSASLVGWRLSISPPRQAGGVAMPAITTVRRSILSWQASRRRCRGQQDHGAAYHDAAGFALASRAQGG